MQYYPKRRIKRVHSMNFLIRRIYPPMVIALCKCTFTIGRMKLTFTMKLYLTFENYLSAFAPSYILAIILAIILALPVLFSPIIVLIKNHSRSLEARVHQYYALELPMQPPAYSFPQVMTCHKCTHEHTTLTQLVIPNNGIYV